MCPHKTHIYEKIFLPAAAILFLAACQSDPKADKAQVTEAQAVTTTAAGATYKADLAQSMVNFIGTKPTGQHNGTFMLKDGSLMADASGITGGKFTIDMASMKITDTDTQGTSKLKGHLLSPDFFDAGKYGTAAFEVTSVKPGAEASTDKEVMLKDATHTVTGNLTLKDVTKSITFPARVAMTDASVTTDADFNIDRSQWNMAYGSDKSLGDKFIRPTVNIKLHIVANK